MAEDTDNLAPKASDELLGTLKRWYTGWDDATATNRLEQKKDLDYYHGIQWTDEEVDELERRGQPVLTFNRIAPVCNYILGDEILKRVDPKAYPRTPQHEDGAEAATDMLRYVDDATDFDDLRSSVFFDMIIPGVAGAVVEVNTDEYADGSKEVEIAHRLVPWDRCWWDPHSRRYDFSDAKYVGTCTWMDLDDAKEFYPGADKTLDITLSNSSLNTTASTTHDDKPSSWVDSKRNRVKVLECYWRYKGQWVVAHFTGGGFVKDPAPTGYLDETGRNECSLVLVSCYVDDEGNRYGVVRNLRSPQDEINKRRSKALHRLNSRGFIAEQGAVQNPEDARMEAAKPDAWITVNEGYWDKLREIDTQSATAVDLQLLQESKAEIESQSFLGMVQNVADTASGRARQVAQKAASIPMEVVQDHLRHWTKAIYTQDWHRIRQFFQTEKWVRVRDQEADEGFRFVGINRAMTRGERLQELLSKGMPLDQAVGMLGSMHPMIELRQARDTIQAMSQQGANQVPPQALEQAVLQAMMQAPSMQERITANQVDRLSVDIIIEESPDVAVLEQEQFESLVSIVPYLQNLPPQIAQMLVEASGLRNKKRIVSLLQQAPDPQAMQQKQQAEQIAMAQAQAELQKTQTESAKNAAQAQKTQAEIPLLGAQSMHHQATAAYDMAAAGHMTVPNLKPNFGGTR